MLDYLHDIESDLSAIHRIDDMWSMPAPKFLRFVFRLPAYQGVMRVIVEQEHERNEKRYGTQPVPLTPAAVATSPGLAGLIDFTPAST